MSTEPFSIGSPELVALGAEYLAARERKNLTVRELAGVAEISGPHITYIERAERNPTLSVLARIGSALGGTFTAHLLRGNEPDAGLLLDDGLSPNDRRFLLALMKQAVKIKGEAERANLLMMAESLSLRSAVRDLG